MGRTPVTVARHRDLVVWYGDPASLNTAALRYAGAAGWLSILWLHDDPNLIDFEERAAIRFVRAHAARSELGNEFDLVVVDLCTVSDSDAIAAVMGTVAGRGRCLLLAPHCRERTRSASFQQQRFHALLQEQARSCPLTDIWYSPSGDTNGPDPDVAHFRTSIECRQLSAAAPVESVQTRERTLALQSELVSALKARIDGGQTGAILLTADRGRGKSAALGQLAATLTESGPQRRMLVCAPTRRATDILYQHFRLRSDEPEPSFIPPDELMEHSANLILVDEAAGIPLSLLRECMTQYDLVIFASTVHGYEGGGRGFALRFSQLLQRDGAAVVHHTLTDPIRWLPGDPLELFCHQAFLLEAPLPRVAVGWQPGQAGLQLERLESEKLAGNETLLQAVYGLLVQAHYRTSPNDLGYMLDSSNLHTFVVRFEDQIVAAALVSDEGPITGIRLRQDILAKQRRPQGQRLPQLLAQFTMLAAALDLQYARVVRIAVHPQLQSQGIGSDFLGQLCEHYQQRHYDVIGAMFGGVPDTVRFWERNGFDPIHCGYRPQNSSGYRSVTVTRALRPAAAQVLHNARILHNDAQQFRNGQLCEPASRRSDRGDCNSYSGTTGTDTTVSASLYDPAVLARYSRGERSFHDSQPALSRLSLSVSPDTEGYEDFLRHCQEPAMSIRDLARRSDTASKAETEARLRTLVNLALSSSLQRKPRDYP